MEKIVFAPEGADGEKAEFYVLEQTRIGGTDYILVTEEEEGDSDALILKDLSKDGEEEAIYAIVEANNEKTALPSKGGVVFYQNANKSAGYRVLNQKTKREKAYEKKQRDPVCRAAAGAAPDRLRAPARAVTGPRYGSASSAPASTRRTASRRRSTAMPWRGR